MTHRWQLPTLDTKFHIDMDWWTAQDRDIRVYMHELLCDSCRSAYAESLLGEDQVDWVDEETGEVSRVDGLWHTIRSCCSAKPDYITPSTPMVDALFRTFIANGNTPLSTQDIYEALDRRPARTWLKMLTGQIYMGIRPVHE